MKSAIYIYACLLLCVLNSAAAADTLYVDQAFTRIDLGKYASLFIDQSGKTTIEELVNGQVVFVDDFSSNQQEKYPTSYWLKVSLRALKTIDTVLVVSPGDANDFITNPVGRMDVYLVGVGGEIIDYKQSGYFISKSKKAFPDLTFAAAVPVSLEKENSYLLYVRTQSLESDHLISLALELRNKKAGLPVPDHRNRALILGPWGMFVIIGLYVLILFVFVNDRAFLYFGICCLFYSIDLFGIYPDGVLYDLLSEYPQYSAAIWHSHFFAIPFMVLFGSAYVDIPGKFPRWSSYYKTVMLVAFVSAAYYTVRNLWVPYTSRQILVTFTILMILPMCIPLLRSRLVPARIFATGFLFFLLGNMLGVFFFRMGFDWYHWVWISGQLGLLIIYAIGLGYRLMQNQKAMAEADKIRELDLIKSRFFTNISHEFRTPLSLILGPLQRSMDQVPQSDMEEPATIIPLTSRSAQVMKRNAERLGQMIDQILDLAKIDQAKMRVHLQERPVIPFLKARISEFDYLAQQKQIHLVSLMPNEESVAQFDPDMVEKIMFNLLSNAIKFTPSHGEVRVEAALNDKFLNVKVSDSGIGMNPEEAAQIFDRFFQANMDDNKGTGIGLALVRELVQLHQGRLAVQSERGKGTSIHWTIAIDRDLFPKKILAPLKDDLASDYSPSGTKVLNAAYLDQNGDTSKIGESLILVVEDHPELLDFIASILSSRHRVIQAKDGGEGIRLAVECLPDLVVSDVMMPEISGYQLCVQLKKDEKTSHIPVILLTAKGSRIDHMEGLNAGADDYLTKPFDAGQLQLKVDNIITTRQRLRDKFKDGLWNLDDTKFDSMDESFLKRVRSLIDQNFSNEYYSVEELAGEMGYSRSQLFRKLKALTGKSPLEWIRLTRLHHAKAMLQKKAVTVSEAAYQVGYSNVSHFSKSFKKEFGISPRQI